MTDNLIDSKIQCIWNINPKYKYSEFTDRNSCNESDYNYEHMEIIIHDKIPECPLVSEDTKTRHDGPESRRQSITNSQTMIESYSSFVSKVKPHAIKKQNLHISEEYHIRTYLEAAISNMKIEDE